MRMLKHVFNGRRGDRTPAEYTDLSSTTAEDESGAATNGSPQSTLVRLAEVETQRDLLAVKDALYDGHVVIVYTDRLGQSELTEQLVIDELLSAVQETDGDIVKKVNGQIIATPGPYAVGRDKIGGV